MRLDYLYTVSLVLAPGLAAASAQYERLTARNLDGFNGARPLAPRTIAVPAMEKEAVAGAPSKGAAKKTSSRGKPQKATMQRIMQEFQPKWNALMAAMKKFEATPKSNQKAWRAAKKDVLLKHKQMKITVKSIQPPGGLKGLGKDLEKHMESQVATGEPPSSKELHREMEIAERFMQHMHT